MGVVFSSFGARGRRLERYWRRDIVHILTDSFIGRNFEGTRDEGLEIEYDEY